MTPGPTDARVTTAAGGPGGMPLALRLSEGLGVTGPEWKCSESCVLASLGVFGLVSLAYPQGSRI